MKKLIALLLAVVMLLSFAACASTEETAEQPAGDDTANNEAAEGDNAGNETADDGSSEGETAEEGAPSGNIQSTLTIGTAQDINELDPQAQNDQINNNCITLTHQGLIYLTNDAAETGETYKPQLAESWEWEDDNTLVFHLYEGITFSDGSPCTAEDCVFTFERAMDPSSAASGNLSLLTGVEARDDLTFVIKTSSYSNDLLSTLSGRPMVILSKAAFESGMEEPWLIGTGQYVFEEWVEGQQASFVKNENYWCTDTEGMNAPGVVDKIIFKPILEASSRVIALQNGEIDVCIDPPTTELQFLEGDDNVVVHTQAGTRLFYLGFNCEKAPFDNKLVRQAVSSAIDKETIVQVVLSGMGKTQNTVVNRGVPTFYDEDDLGAYTYDVEKAKELLAEAGYAEGELTVDLYAATDDPYKTIAPLIQANLLEIGINVNIVSLDQNTLKAACQKGDQQMFLWRWNVIDRLSEIYQELFGTGYTSNYHHFSDPTVDEMAEEVLTIKDQDERTEKSIELQKYLAEESPQVPLYVADLVIAYRNGLTGTYLFGGGNHVWTHAYVAN